MSNPPQPRKRSKAVGLTAVGAMTMLAACDSGPTEEELSRQMFGAPTEVATFANADECSVAGQFTKQQCDEAAQTAWNDSSKTAPRFESRTDCENQFGNCQSGGGFFMPMMTGFMIASALNSGPRYAPLYRSRRDNNLYTGSGAFVYGGTGSASGKKYIGERGLDRATPKIQTRSAIRARGGFGTRASMRGGGWGG